MVEIRNISVSDLRYHYRERPGFVFLTLHSVSDESIHNLSFILKSVELSDSLPEFVTRFDGGVAFVYPEGSGFSSGRFIYVVYNHPILSRLARIDALKAWANDTT